MKKGIIIAVIALFASVFIAFYISRSEGDMKEQVGSWHAEYLKKQKRHHEGVSGNKKMRIKEVEKYFKGIRTKFGEEESNYPANYLLLELEKLQKQKSSLKSTDAIEWVERGPGNVGGRTRAVIVDVSDPSNKTWFAGSATGGVWKTTDEGESWNNISEDIPYHAISTLIQSPSNPTVLYAGTGESFPGSIYTTGGGVFKSSDKGDSWSQIEYTAGHEGFKYVNRLAVHPTDTNILVAVTTTGIYKTIDGGVSWGTMYETENSVEDLKADPDDFNTLYAGVNALGILRSIDAGETWDTMSDGILPGNGRFEIAVSPSNTSRLFISVENSIRESDVYVTSDKGANWNLISNTAGSRVEYLGGQGGYDNAIAVHPYNEDSVFVAGVNSWKIGVTDTKITNYGYFNDFDTINTLGFIDLVDFGGVFPGIITGDEDEATNLYQSDYVSVEIRFGAGLSQKAHRFTVPSGSTNGVAASDYTYRDYVEVPFEVWDVTNNRQLMCSFRDQERDSEFNLYETTGSAYGEFGREYIFINAVEYDAVTPDANIATQGGRTYKQIYFLWTVLADGGTWDADNLPESKMYIEAVYPELIAGEVMNVSDAYGQFGGPNSYDQRVGFGETSIPGFHPDHHVLTMIPIDESSQSFWVVNGNDGGLGLSKDNGVTFDQIANDYVTTQFYGVSKKPYRDEYIGGMQDNGTWQSPSYESASLETDYRFRTGGDGFESVWQLIDTNNILASTYYNDIYISRDHGENWYNASSGITEDDGPFITKLTMIPSNSRKVFAVGSAGLYYTKSFGITGWSTIEMPEGWIASGGSLSSSHQIEYSIANDSILWAGAAISEDFGLNVFVSTDLGGSFTAVNYPADTNDAYVSTIATHPTEPNTAYLVYSLYGEAKIIRTEDLGQTWEDITGFESGSSSNGFPDVGCLSLMVFPDNTDRIWAGTELGIVESLDNGESWNLLESSLPTVPVYQMFMQDNQVVVATYGRGIWTYQYGDVVEPPKVSSVSEVNVELSEVKVYPIPTRGTITIDLPSELEYQEVKLSVYSLKGDLQKSLTIYGSSTQSVELSDLSTGVYFMNISGNNKSITKKISIVKE